MTKNQSGFQVHFPETVHTIKKERVASGCICCGRENLKSSPAVLMPFISSRIFGWEPVVIDASWGLKTISNGNAYSLGKTLQWIECGFVSLDIRFSEAELVRLYRDYRGNEYTTLRDHYEPGYRERNKLLQAGTTYNDAIEGFLSPYLSFPVCILDWGGDTGKNTPFKDQSQHIDIYDIGGSAVVSCAQQVSKDKAYSTRYDLIVCSNVLEHVPYPADVIIDIKKAMNESSILYLEVPFEDVMKNQELNLPMCKKHWHEHINFFSKRSLLVLLDQCGLTVVDLRILEIISEGKFSSQFQLACRLD